MAHLFTGHIFIYIEKSDLMGICLEPYINLIQSNEIRLQTAEFSMITDSTYSGTIPQHPADKDIRYLQVDSHNEIGIVRRTYRLGRDDFR